jgi:hypothetical protein
MCYCHAALFEINSNETGIPTSAYAASCTTNKNQIIQCRFIADCVYFELQDIAKSDKRDGCVLKPSDVRNIYKLRFLAHRSTSAPNYMSNVSVSVLLSEQYNVASKTIRDIWNRKTWTQTTQDLFEHGETDAMEPSNMHCAGQEVCAFLCTNA